MAGAGPAAALEGKSEDDLRAILAEREVMLGDLLKEVESLERTPQLLEDRLRRLEHYFRGTRPDDRMPFRSPELHALGKVMKANPAAGDVARGRAPRLTPGQGADSSHMVNGRYEHLAFDRMALNYTTQDFLPFQCDGCQKYFCLHEAQPCETAGENDDGGVVCPFCGNRVESAKIADLQRKPNYHPTVDEVHFCGHLSSRFPAQPVVLGSRSCRERVMASLLDEASHKVRSDEMDLFEPPEDMVPGLMSQDDQAVDWLGLKRRGLPIPEDLGIKARADRAWF